MLPAAFLLEDEISITHRKLRTDAAPEEYHKSGPAVNAIEYVH